MTQNTEGHGAPEDIVGKDAVERSGREWTARFISAPEGTDPDPAPYFRCAFSVSQRPARALLHATALGIVEPHLNGSRVGNEVLTPGWTSYRHRVVVATHDVTDLVRAGENILGAIVGRGWAAGRLGWAGRRGHYTDRPALFLELELEFPDGSTRVVGTDDSFRVSTGAVLKDDLYDGEVYDARREPCGWSEPGFDASGWARALTVAWDPSVLTPREAEPIRRTETLCPVSLSTSPDGTTIADFGQIVTGWVRLRVEGTAGQEITLRHAELLDAEGRLERRTLRSAEATDRYVLSGGGKAEVWEPRFTIHGFRYAEIEGWDGSVPAEALQAVVVHSDMRRTGWFETSDASLNRLHSNILWGMRGNFVGLPTDCPQRDERFGWTGDINVFGPTAAFLYDVRAVLGSWLADVRAEHLAKGYVPWYVPDTSARPSAPTGLWGDVVISLPWALYQEYGDRGVLEAMYPSMSSYMEQVEALLDQGGLWSKGYQFGDWLDPDAPEEDAGAAKTDKHLVASAYLCRTTRELVLAAGVLGHDRDADRWAALASRVRSAFRREYVTPNGRLAGETATAYALAIRFGILEPGELQHAGDRLAAIVAASRYRISTGFAGTPHVADALTETGHLEDAYRLLTQTEQPSFLYPVLHGATTVWERWDAVRPDGTLHPSSMTSLNHYALGAIADWMHRTIGGLAPLEPGYSRMRIAPAPGAGLTHASLEHETVHGPVSVRWRLTGNRMGLDVSVPPGTRAIVALPRHPQKETHEVGPGDHCWAYDVEPEDATLDLDTPMSVIAADSGRWKAVMAVMRKHFPQIPADQDPSAAEDGPDTLRLLVERIRGEDEQLESDLLAAIHSGATA